MGTGGHLEESKDRDPEEVIWQEKGGLNGLEGRIQLSWAPPMCLAFIHTPCLSLISLGGRSHQCHCVIIPILQMRKSRSTEGHIALLQWGRDSNPRP